MPLVVDVSEHDPDPPDNVAVQLADPSVTATFPVGVSYDPLTVTPTVYARFTTLGSGLSLVIVVVLVALFTVCDVVPDELLYVLFPPYVAVKVFVPVVVDVNEHDPLPPDNVTVQLEDPSPTVTVPVGVP